MSNFLIALTALATSPAGLATLAVAALVAGLRGLVELGRWVDRRAGLRVARMVTDWQDIDADYPATVAHIAHHEAAHIDDEWAAFNERNAS